MLSSRLCRPIFIDFIEINFGLDIVFGATLRLFFVVILTFVFIRIIILGTFVVVLVWNCDTLFITAALLHVYVRLVFVLLFSISLFDFGLFEIFRFFWF